jgi:hypothetical protein
MISPKIKRFLVDVLVLNCFIILVAFLVEVVLSGIPFSVFWRGRLTMVLPNILTIELYNKTRNLLDQKLAFGGLSSYSRQFIRDVFAFIIFRVPLGFAVLLFLGAPMHKVLMACLAATVVAGFSGRPYGIVLDKARAFFGVRA